MRAVKKAQLHFHCISVIKKRNLSVKLCVMSRKMIFNLLHAAAKLHSLKSEFYFNFICSTGLNLLPKFNPSHG